MMNLSALKKAMDAAQEEKKFGKQAEPNGWAGKLRIVWEEN